METNKIYQGDCLQLIKTIPDNSIDCCITSPPYYGLRDYGVEGQIGLEQTPEEYVNKMVELFHEIRRVLKPEGTFWLNLGDSYAGSGCGTNDYRTEASRSINKTDKMYCKKPPQQKKMIGLKPKDLIGIPWRVAFALQADGWYLRQDIIWAKPNPMPESVTDRCTKSHEYIFLMSKEPRYYFDNEAIKEKSMGIGKTNIKFGGNKYGENDDPKYATKSGNEYEDSGYRNKRSVWTVNTKPYHEAHFATFPEELIKPMVLAGCPEGGIVLDPFMGAGTTALVALKLERKFVGIELNPEYIRIAERRIYNELNQQRLIL